MKKNILFFFFFMFLMSYVNAIGFYEDFTSTSNITLSYNGTGIFTTSQGDYIVKTRFQAIAPKYYYQRSVRLDSPNSSMLSINTTCWGNMTYFFPSLMLLNSSPIIQQAEVKTSGGSGTLVIFTFALHVANGSGNVKKWNVATAGSFTGWRNVSFTESGDIGVIVDSLSITWDMCLAEAFDSKINFLNISGLFPINGTTNKTVNNTLPTINSTDFDIGCFNTTSKNANINLTVTAIDLEGDTLYYSLTSSLYSPISYLYQQDFISNSGSVCTADTSFFGSKYFSKSNYTATAINNLNCLTQHITGIPILCEETETVTYNIDGVYYESCDGYLSVYNLDNSRPFYFYVDSVLNRDLTYKQKFKINRDNNIIYRQVFFDRTGKQIFNLTWNNTNSFLSLVYNNTIISNITGYSKYLLQQILYFNFSDNTISIDLATQATPFYIYKNMSSFGFVGHYINSDLNLWNSQIIINDFEFSGTTTKEIITNHINANDINGTFSILINSTTKGNREINLYVTDSLHLTESVNSYKYIINIPECKYDFTIPKGDFKDLSTAIKESEYTLCSTFDNMFNIPIGFCGLITWVVAGVGVVFAFAIIGMFSVYAMIPITTMLSILMLFWSLWMLGFSFFIQYSNTWRILIAVILSLSIISFILNVMFTGGNNE